MKKIKQALSVIAFDDGWFQPRKKGQALLVGVVYRLDHRLEGLLSTRVQVDGWNVSEKIIELVKNSKFKPQAKYLLFSGLNFAGFNVLDLKKVFRELKIPLIVVFRKKFSLEKMLSQTEKVYQN